MSFLEPLLSSVGKPGAGAASGLGHLIGADPSRISRIAGGIGNAANGIAAAGGASPGYAAPQQTAPPEIANHMQLLDPATLQAVLQHFRPAARGQNQMEQY